MTKDELKEEAEESAEKFFEKLFNFIDWFAPNRATNDLVTQMLICIQDKFYSMQKENAELEQENNKLLDVINNQDVKIADLEQQIEKMKCCQNCKHCAKIHDYDLDDEEDSNIEYCEVHCYDKSGWELRR